MAEFQPPLDDLMGLVGVMMQTFHCGTQSNEPPAGKGAPLGQPLQQRRAGLPIGGVRLGVIATCQEVGGSLVSWSQA